MPLIVGCAEGKVKSELTGNSQLLRHKNLESSRAGDTTSSEGSCFSPVQKEGAFFLPPKSPPGWGQRHTGPWERGQQQWEVWHSPDSCAHQAWGRASYQHRVQAPSWTPEAAVAAMSVGPGSRRLWPLEVTCTILHSAFGEATRLWGDTEHLPQIAVEVTKEVLQSQEGHTGQNIQSVSVSVLKLEAWVAVLTPSLKHCKDVWDCPLVFVVPLRLWACPWRFSLWKWFSRKITYMAFANDFFQCF